MSRHKKITWVILLGTAILFPASGIADPTPRSAEAFDETAAPNEASNISITAEKISNAVGQMDGLAEHIIQKTGIPGLAISIVHNGKLVYAKGFGVRKLGEKAPVDADTVFQLASISKSLTASVLATQVAEGKIRWDAPVVQYIPSFQLADPWVTAHVTFADLLSHQAGLPDHANDVLEDIGYGRQDFIHRLRYLPSGPFRVGSVYTNVGPTIAGEAAAHVAGTDWASLAQDKIFGPLGAKTLSFRHSDFLAHENRAEGHIRVGSNFKPLYHRNADVQAPAGGASASARDFARWMIMILQNGTYEGQQVVASEALLPAITAQTVTHASDSPVGRPSLAGYGFNVGITPAGRTTLSHSGGFLLGTGTNYTLLPSANLGIAVFTHATPTGAAETLTAEFVDLVQFGRITRDWYAAYRGFFAHYSDPVGSLHDQERPATPAPAQSLEDYAGHYSNEYAGDITIEKNNDGLLLKLGPEKREIALRHWSGDRFSFEFISENSLPGSVFAADFAKGQGGTIDSVTLELIQNQGPGVFNRVP